MASNFPNADLEDSSWQTDVQKNLSLLTKSLNDLDSVLFKLLEHNLISDNEFEIIRQQETSATKNWKLLYTLKAKGWSRIKSTFIQILKETNHDFCVHIIESSSTQHPHSSSLPQTKKEEFSFNETVQKRLIKSKWWPEKKILPNSFYERKIEKELFTNRLKSLLTQQENTNKTTVINQKVAVSGLGGVGKSTTAKWFGHQYEKYYELILWIDCGEGSLTKSFTNLARELNVKDRKELELKDLARGCFEILEKRNCLLIYDNAECYVGVDGIRDVLPKNNDKFHIIITSRNREWGNDTGYGKIPEFQLDIFEKSEALDFMSKNIDCLINKDESHLEKMCELLGNLPLALQIAVAAVNRNHISLSRYTEILKNTEEILLTTVDDYEKTINRTMRTSLDIIQNSEKDVGGLAYQILSIFGFVSPDDVELDFFKSVKKKRTDPEIYRAAKMLASYSLVTHKTITKDNASKTTEVDVGDTYSFLWPTDRGDFMKSEQKIMTKENGLKIQVDVLSIHRLLQQVIRHNSMDKKTEILRTILNCEGFLEHKLISYSYADKELQREFPKLKAEFIQKLQLKQLLDKRKFKEAMELSHIIKDTLKDFKSHYNYALCLKYNNEIKFAIKNFKKVFQLVTERISGESGHIYYFNQFGILEGSNEFPLEVVGGQLLLLYYHQKLDEEAKQLLKMLPTIIFPHTDINEVFLTLNWIWNTKPKSSYQFNYDGHENLCCLSISRKCEDPIKKMQLLNCVLNENFQLKQLPKDLDELILFQVKLMADGDECTATKLYLDHTNFVRSIQLATVVEMTITRSQVNIDILPMLLQKLKLDECYLVVNSLSPSSPTQQPLPYLQELTLSRIQTMGDSYERGIKPINISRFLSPKLTLIEASHFWNGTPMPKVLIIPLTCLRLIKHLSLEGCKLVHADGVRIAPQSLKLVHVQIIDNNEHDLSHKLLNDFIDLMNLQSIFIEGMSIDLCSPVSINTVELSGTQIFNWKQSNCCINQLDLHDIDVVEQTKMTVKEMTIYGSLSLVHISLLPQSLVILHLSDCTLAASCLFSADKNQFPCLQKLLLVRVNVNNTLGNTDGALDAPLRLPCYLTELIIKCLDSNIFTLDLLDLLHIPNCNLQKCNLVYNPSIVLSPKVLVLNNINIIEKNTKNVIKIPINEFVRFTQTEVLSLKGMAIDFAESVRVSLVFLLNTELINWKNGKWCIDRLYIWPAPVPTTMTIKHQEIDEELCF